MSVSLGQPLLRIHAVAELTGIPSATLRAWERRYGVPTPARTASAYRLYGERDVEMVKAMQRLCESGLSAAEAARAVLAMPEKNPAEASQLGIYDAAIERIVEAVRRYDGPDLESALHQTMLLGNALEVYERVFGPLLVRIGELWHAGRLSVGQEHFASERILEAIRSLLRLVQPDAGRHTVLVACFADEEHALGAIGAGLAFASAGCRVVNLGARTPPAAVADAVRTAAPDLVALSLTVEPPPQRGRELVAEYAQAMGRTPWVVGGRGVGQLAERIESAGGFVATGSAAEWQKHLRTWPRGARPKRRHRR